jgi:chemotaxis protein methyltransferase CheR
MRTDMQDLSMEDFRTIRNLIRERCGIWLSDAKTQFLAMRLNHRLKATNTDTVKEYFFFLKYDPNGGTELDDLVDAVTVNETYFFRENAQLEDFSNELAPKILEKKQRGAPLSIWSAGCSSGEEPYTLAMMLLEHPLISSTSMINVFGSDINRGILGAAREGRYDDYSVRHVPPHYLLKYFDKTPDGRYAVKEQVKQLVKFAHVNFMDPFSTGRMREMDAIFCRNVMIYFDDKDKGRCMDNLRRSLAKGGYLFLGHSEILSRTSSRFDVVRLKQTTAYRNV